MKRYDNIQILRVLACLGVYFTHIAPKMGITGVWGKIANFGASGVYLFFLVSAFLACDSPALRSGGAGRKGRAVRFSYYIRRAFRILPLYYAVILYHFLLHTFLLRDVPADPAGLGWLRYLFLTGAVLPAPDNFWGNLSGTWTISLFAAFYLCAPFLVRMAGEGKEEKGGPARAVLLYAASLLLQQIWIRQSFSDYMMFFYYLHFFVLGILLNRLASCYAPVAAAGRFLLICAAAGLGLYLTTGSIPYFTAVSWMFGLILLLTLNFSWDKAAVKEGGKSPASLCRALLKTLDTYSYGIYLVHEVVVEGIVLVQAHIPLFGFPVFAIVTLFTTAGVIIARKWIEAPMQRLGEGAAKRVFTNCL